ncbi:hypothetical protein CDL15_Pgr017425 [Punica granatum]|uniref:Uncharacterized protein n=1 Tax=Punica granatum TaxID=22663 RepID=A0A218Y2I0_PUNGR|nr:hypothetical protein CDL15_Pgr017425 [Punica granatum]PKI66134.1 hypothetical protein CRG98_013492 [Punica granatum]
MAGKVGRGGTTCLATAQGVEGKEGGGWDGKNGNALAGEEEEERRSARKRQIEKEHEAEHRECGESTRSVRILTDE